MLEIEADIFHFKDGFLDYFADKLLVTSGMTQQLELLGGTGPSESRCELIRNFRGWEA